MESKVPMAITLTPHHDIDFTSTAQRPVSFNATILIAAYKPRNASYVVDLELLLAERADTIILST